MNQRRHNIDIEGSFSFILSGRAVGEAVKLIDEETENVEISFGDRLVSFNISGYSFISRLLEGEFVNYQKTIPAEHRQRVVVNTRELTNTIERVSLLISESFSTPIRCYFNELNEYFGTRSLSWNGIQFLSHFLRSKEKSSNRNTGRRALSMPGTPHCQG